MYVESILDEVKVWSRQAKVMVRMGHNFWSNRWIAFKILQELTDALFHWVDVESILGEAEVLSPLTRVTVQKGHNFWFDRLITIKSL